MDQLLCSRHNTSNESYAAFFLDALRFANTDDHTFIFGCSRGLTPIIETLLSRGIVVSVASSLKKTRGQVSRKHIVQADHFVDLRELNIDGRRHLVVDGRPGFFDC